jgi:hypothetical protein
MPSRPFTTYEIPSDNFNDIDIDIDNDFDNIGVQPIPDLDNDEYRDLAFNHHKYTCDELYEILTSVKNLSPKFYKDNTSNMIKITIINEHVNQFHDGLFDTCILNTVREDLIKITNFCEE